MKFIVTLTFLFASLLTFSSEPSDSLFTANISGVDQQDKPATLSQWQGKWQVVAFVYTDCTSLCPIIIADLNNLNAKLTSKQKQHSVFTLISINPEKDSPEHLKHFLQEHVKNAQHWNFLRLDQEQLELVAMLFNIKMRKEGDEIAHSRSISLLNADGHLVYQSVGNEGIEKFLKLIPR